MRKFNPKNLKLLYIANALFPQNVANRIQIMNMCEAFSKNNINLTLLAFESKEFKSKKHLFKYYNIKKEFDLILLKPFRRYILRDLKLFFNFLKLQKKFNFIFTRALVPALSIKTFFKNKFVVYELHEIRKSKIWKSLFKLMFKKIDKLIVISNGLRKELIEKNFDVNKIIVLPDGVSLEKFKLKITKKEARKKLKLPLNKKIVMYVGGLQKWKGIDTLIEAFNKLKNKEVVLFIVGGTKKEIEKYKRKAKENIYFIEFQKQEKVPFYLKAADILILPNSAIEEISKSYTSPLKLFEYMASKRPIIGSDLPSIREIVSEKDILFFKPDNSEDLALKIKKLASNKKLQTKLIKNAYEKVKKYSWEKRAKKIVSIFKSR